MNRYLPLAIVLGLIIATAVILLTVTTGSACGASKTPKPTTTKTAKPTATSKPHKVEFDIDHDCD